MLCCHCKKNQAAKTYEWVKNGEKQTDYYCLDCYEQNFLSIKEGEKTLSACPYCGATKESILLHKLVGCGYCYKMLEEVVMPLVTGMQNTSLSHKGKKPPLLGDIQVEEISLEYEAKLRADARFQRQCNELKSVIAKLLSDGEFEGAREYQEKLKKMEEKLAVEEDFVWRQTNLSKQT